MEYFLIETNEKNNIPYKINKNRAIDIRLLTREKFHQIPMWNLMEMDFPMEGFSQICYAVRVFWYLSA